jgi:hypothetical protein
LTYPPADDLVYFYFYLIPFNQCGYADKISQKQSMIKTKHETRHKPNHKKKHTNIQNSNPPPSAVGGGFYPFGG